MKNSNVFSRHNNCNNAKPNSLATCILKKGFALILCFLISSAAFAGNRWPAPSKKNTDPWHSMMTILYQHGLDTTELNVMSIVPISDEMASDIVKSYHIKKKSAEFYSYRDKMLGTIITDHLKMAMGRKRKGEKYDYEIARFNPKFNHFDYELFTIKYPSSKFTEELNAKQNCLEQYNNWLSSASKEKRMNIYERYGVSHCPYPGFENISQANNAMRKLVEDWKVANMLHTVQSFQKFIEEYPYATDEVGMAERKIEDIQAWQQAVSEGTHQSYSYYYNTFVNGDSVSVAGELLRLLEEPAWEAACQMHTADSYEHFVEKYPNGYYKDSALNRQLDIELGVFKDYEDNMADILPEGFNSRQGYSLLLLGNVDKEDNIIYSLQGPTPAKVILKPGECRWVTLKNGKYHFYVTSNEGAKYEGKTTFIVEDGIYSRSFYTYTSREKTKAELEFHRRFWKGERDITVDEILDEIASDSTAAKRFRTECFERLQQEYHNLLKQDLNSKKKIVRNVYKRYYEDENDKEGYEIFFKLSESDYELNLIIQDYGKIFENDLSDF